MKQILQSYKSGELWLAEVPAPKCLRNGVRIAVKHTLISAGTEKRMVDLAKSSLLQKAMKRPDQVKRVIQKIKSEGLLATYQQVQAKLDNPVPLGYSAAGVVTEVGVEAVGFMPGDRVACAGVGYANHAEIVTAPHTLTVKLPDNVSTEQASYTTLGAIAMQAVRQAEVQIGEYVGVIGLGLLGNLVVQILAAAGARVLAVDLDPSKIELAVRCGAEKGTKDLQGGVRELTKGRGLDKIIVAAGSKDSTIIGLCPAALRHRGRVVVLGFVGMDCPHQEFYEKELELRMSMSYGPGRYDPVYEDQGRDYPYAFVRWTEQRNMESFLALISAGRVNVDVLTTHRYLIDEALTAYQLLETRERYLGIVLSYPNEERQPRLTVPMPASKREERSASGLALMGTGNFATGILGPIMKELGVPVKWVVSGRGPQSTHTAKAIAGENASTDFQAALNDPATSHVVIATRHAAHAGQTTAALKAGKTVHVEKPMCVSREELAGLVELVSTLGAEARVHVGFNRRYSPLSSLLKSELDRRIGQPKTVIYRINAGVLTKDHWFYGDPGGRITAEGCHFIDYAMYLLGTRPRSVSCSVKSLPGAPFDSFCITLSFADGSMASIIYAGDGDRSLSKEHIEVFCGGACWVNNDWSSLIRHENGVKKALYKGSQSKGWRESMAHFLGKTPAPQAGLTWPAIVASHEVMFEAVESALATSATEAMGGDV